MPLSAPVAREHFHTRRIECQGYQRADGLWDIEAFMVDTKTYAFHNSWRGDMQPGTPLHGMALRITLDEKFVVHDIEAVTDHSPFPACPDILPNFSRLKGERIGRGWGRRVKELLGGVQGCTHLVELLAPVATTAFQTIRPGGRGNGIAQAETPEIRKRRTVLINSCHAWAEDGEVVRRLLAPTADTPAPQVEGVPANTGQAGGDDG